jgi:hypothetical protein
MKTALAEVFGLALPDGLDQALARVVAASATPR